MKGKTPEKKLLFTIREAAEELHCSTDTIYFLIRERRLPAVTFGRQRRIPAQLLEEWLDETSTTGRSLRQMFPPARLDPFGWLPKPGDADPVGVAEIAERLGVPRQTVAVWKNRGLLPPPPWRVSRQPCWDWPQIEAWAEASGRMKS